ncbi:hypothetical protein [Natronobacterium gregoryi]|uniref:Uncharacterized protein n=2 Tax=Natronobacterium gregoryi TaxID=44930 RepID=L0AI98_NATGS|nr:hypothetical protein [Natronobacterium gregoryi]AFZ73536.1 hypothetical protein Natgr_2364 [Natronobacterium gregoryi SP2]ELY68203.1 hypothetical protein C490_09970 [Natronobacterium gregoryi SP2]PLK20563.1 hypothetical protein CYV19_08965 [Natronobacterium gregoryi SP2]SFJ17099.1 hypothetical protein SAMN05443661_11639 [Natronobacterium gregoryi]
MDIDKDRLPRWGWLLIGLLGASITAQLINALVFAPAGLAEEYWVVTVITAMAPVLIYLGVWYEDDRQHYWEYPRERIVGDLAFVLLGAAVGSALAIVALVDFGIPRLLREIVAMGVGFLFSWLLFGWRNQDLYDVGPE